MSKAPNILQYEIIKGTAEFITGAFLWIKNKSIPHTNITACYLTLVANSTSRGRCSSFGLLCSSSNILFTVFPQAVVMDL